MAENFNITARLQLGAFQKDSQKLLKDVRVLKNKVETGAKSKVKLDTKDANNQINKFNKNLKQTGTAAGTAGGKVRSLNKNIKQTSNSMKDVARRVFVWGALSAAIFGALQNLKELFTFTIKVNTAMGQLRKILPDLDDFSQLKGSAFEFAIEFGQDPSEVITLLRRFAQSGLSVEESISAARNALLAMNVANVSTEESMSALIGASRIFKIEFSEMEQVIDKIIAVERSFAVDSKDLIQSITAIGPAITVFGGDIDDLFSLIATLSEAARISGKEASNSLKRVLSRLASPEGINALQKIGVNVFKTQNEFRKLRDILGDLAKTFPKLSDAERQSVAITLAQTRQFPKFLALLSNYDRTLIALDISQRAFGESAQANEVIMATYEKRMATTSAEIKQLAESLFTSGVTDLFLALKDTLSILLGVLSLVPSSLLTMGLGLGALALITKGLKAAMFGFTGELAAQQRGLKLSTIAMGGFNKQSSTMRDITQKGGKTQDLAISRGHRWTAGLFLVGAALVILSPLISAFYRKLTRGSRVQAKVIKDLEKFKSSLQAIDFEGFKGLTGDERFNSIIGVFKEVTEQTGTASKKLVILKEKLSEVFFGVSTSELTQKQFDQLETSVSSLTKKLKQLSFESFFKEISSVLNEEVAPAADLAGRSIFNLGKFFKSFGSAIGGAFSGDFGLKFVANFNTAINDLEFSIGKLNSELNALSTKKVIPDSIIDSAKIGLGSKAIDKTVEALAKLVLQSGLLERAADNAGVVLTKAMISDDFLDRGKLANEVWERLAKQIKAAAKIKFGDSDIGKFFEELTAIDLKNQFEDSSEGIKLQQLSIASFLSAVKRSNFGVIKTFQAQLEIIKAVGSANRDLNQTFSTTNEVAKAASQAVNNLISKHAANIAKISQLEDEIKVAQGLLEKGGFQQTTLDQILKKQNNIRVELAAQEAIVAVEREHFDELLKTALKIEAAAKKAVQVEKQRENALKSQVTSLVNYEKFLSRINNITISNPFESFKDSEDRAKRILSLELDSIDLLQSQGFLEKNIAETKKEQLKNVSDIEESSKRMVFLQKQISSLYSDIDGQVDSIASSVSGLISDQEAFLGFLDGQESFLEFLGGGFQDLAQAFTDSDAETIANAIRSPLRDALAKEKEELQLLLEKVQDPNLFGAAQAKAFPGLESSIIAGHKKGGQAAAEELIKALETIFIPQLDAIAEKSQFPNSAIANLSTDAEIEKLTKIEKNTKDIADIAKGVGPSGSGGSQIFDGGALNELITVDGEIIEGLNKIPSLLDRLDALPSVFDNLGAALESEKIVKAIENSPEKTGIEFDDVQKARNKELVSSLSRRLGVMMAQSLAIGLGGDPAKVQTGSNIGAILGAGAGLAFGFNPATGAAIGQGLGAIIGGLFGKEEEKQTIELTKIRENTAQLVDRLSPEILNAPANFVLPSSQSLRGGINISNLNVTVGAGVTQGEADSVASQIEDSIRRTFRNSSPLE